MRHKTLSDGIRSALMNNYRDMYTRTVIKIWTHTGILV